MTYVYLKFKSNTGSNSVDVIPLKATSISVTTDKTIPSMGIPFSGLATGESITAALDIGMSSKSISIQGVILPVALTRNTKHGGGTKNFTAQEIAQLIHSGVDSTGVAKYQAFDELVFLIPSIVDEDYDQVTERNIPFTFASRGSSNNLDNFRVPVAADFPTSETSEGVKGFIRSFGTDFSAEVIEVVFTMTFEVATIFP
jgi:hypothetical protein